jgi:hypothetical protein
MQLLVVCVVVVNEKTDRGKSKGKEENGAKRRKFNWHENW